MGVVGFNGEWSADVHGTAAAMFGMGNHGPRQGEGEKNRAKLAAFEGNLTFRPHLVPVPDPSSPLWSAHGLPDQLQIDAPPEGPGASFAFADFTPDTDQLAILADPKVTRLAGVTTLSAPEAPITLIQLEFLWVERPQHPGYHLQVMVAGQHHFTLEDLLQIAAPATSTEYTAEWVNHHPSETDTVTIAASGFFGPLHMIEVSQIYDEDRASKHGRFVEHCSRFYIYSVPDLDPAAILAPFAEEDWRLLAKLPGVAKVFEITLSPREISPDSDAARDYPLFITDRDLASKQSLNYHY